MCCYVVLRGIPVWSVLFSGSCCILPFLTDSCVWVVFGCPILLSAESAIVSFWCFPFFPVLSCLDFLDRFLFCFFMIYQCGWYSGVFVSSVVTVLGDVFNGCVQVYGFSRMSFSRSLLSVMLVISFDINRSSCFMSLKSQFFSRVISFVQCSSGVSISFYFAQKSPQLW